MNTTLTFLSSALLVAVASAAEPQPKLQCDSSRWMVDGLTTHCEIRETTALFSGSLDVNASPNGGISVTGWDQPFVLIREMVQTVAPSDAAARALSSQVQAVVEGVSVTSTGPHSDSDHQWSLTYEIFLPQAANLTLKTINGGINITSINGQIRYQSTNGGVTLDSLAGDVQGQVVNGGLTVQLAGDHWDGKGLDAKMTNGGVSLKVPAGYSAHLELSTKLGTVRSDIPLAVVKSGFFAKSASGDVGAGGALIHAATVNGAINISTLPEGK